MGETTYWLKGRPWRHGYRIEGSYVEKIFGKTHMFFQNSEEALKAIKEKGGKPEEIHL